MSTKYISDLSMTRPNPEQAHDLTRANSGFGRVMLRCGIYFVLMQFGDLLQYEQGVIARLELGIELTDHRVLFHNLGSLLKCTAPI